MIVQHRSASVFALLLIAACAGETPAPTAESMISGHNHPANGIATKQDKSTEISRETESAINVAHAATARFHPLANLLKENAVLASPCLAIPTGGMGFHYLREALLDDKVEYDKPEFVMYTPDKHGKMEMGGVEFMVLADAWDAKHDSPPMFGTQVFNDHRAPEARHGLPFAHYELHVWLWTPNPDGIFAPWNPSVSCPAA
ncbi:MAG: hypothetical protein V4558_12780 [Gemmatimonadota bacterium]